MRASEFLREFAPDGYQQYTLYVGSPRRHKIGTFASVDDAVEEAHFLWNVDPRAGTDYWTVTDLNDTVVWSHDPGEVYDQMRSGSKIKYRKPDDLKETDEQDLTALKEACENWMEMYFDANDINTILTHPYSQKFKTPGTDIENLYRGLIVKGNKFKAVPKKSNRKFVAYATDSYGAEAFLASLDIGGRQVIIEKEYHPENFILDFTGLYESLFPDLGYHNRYQSEYEVWMQATPYYTSVDETEIISDTAWDDTDDGEPGRGNL
jgi:hypothetical protein